jgi:hypothetical protein
VADTVVVIQESISTTVVQEVGSTVEVTSPGPQGATGSQGPAGPQGAQGPQGATGLQGPKGDTGETGEQGPAGPNGAQGASGTQGPQGLQGPKGDAGDTGPQGPQGQAGEAGAAGATGATGPQGPSGATGATGATGPGVAAGGTSGQVLTKTSATNYDTTWTSSLTLAGLTLSTFTQGSVPFAGASGVVSEDNQNFNWNASNKQIGISSAASERITNGTFTGSSSGWSLTTGWAYSSNAVSHSSNGTGTLSQSLSLSLGERCDVSFTLSNITAGGCVVSFAGNSLGTLTTNGTYTYRVEVSNTSQGIVFTPTATSARFTVDTVSAKVLTGGKVLAGNITIQGSGSDGVATISAVGKSNSIPGTTKHVSLENTGGFTWIDFKFQGTNVAHFGADSSGQVATWVSGGNGDAVYHKPTNTLISYNVPNTFTHYGYGAFNYGVNAGSTFSPTSTLTSQGGTALKVKHVTANQTLDNTASKWIADPSTAACTGSPSNVCSSYTNQSDCVTRDAHGGCSWFAGYSCSTYSGDQSNCQGTSGCNWDTASCSAVGAYDQYSCESYSGCSWANSPQDCSGFDEYTCGVTSGCSQSFDYCYNYSDGGGDGYACTNANYPGFCSYDSGTGACDGSSWYTGCSGSYDSYSCTGSYDTGTCSGTYGAACSGSASCSGIDDSTNCNNEPGCTWQTAITLTLPNMTSCPDRDYWIYNTSSSNADVVIVPSAGQQVNHTTSYTLSSYRDWVHLSPYYLTASCSSISEGSCASTSGCSPLYYNCTWNSMDNVCDGGAGCSGYGDQSSCESATYYSGCSGTYVVSQNWYVFGK